MSLPWMSPAQQHAADRQCPVCLKWFMSSAQREAHQDRQQHILGMAPVAPAPGSLTVLVGPGLEIALQLDDASVRKSFGLAMERRGKRLALMATRADLTRLRAACENEGGNHPEAAYRTSCNAAARAITKVLDESQAVRS